MSLLAIDMGSSSCKAVAFSLEGKILAERSHAYSPETPRPAWAQVPAEVFWDALRDVTGGIVNVVSGDSVDVLAISSHAEAFVPVNEQLQPVGPAILNMDNRAVSQANWLAEALRPRHVFEITGLAVHPMYPVPKILWMRENQSDTFRKAAKFLGVIDYLLTRLGLPACIDYSQASAISGFRHSSETVVGGDSLNVRFDSRPLCCAGANRHRRWALVFVDCDGLGITGRHCRRCSGDTTSLARPWEWEWSSPGASRRRWARMNVCSLRRKHPPSMMPRIGPA